MICPRCKGSRMVFKRIENTVMLGHCPMCGGLGEIKGTNFQRITASPEALVRWVSEIADFCDRGCSHCPVQEKCLYDSDGAGNKGNDELLLEWLNEESEE